MLGPDLSSEETRRTAVSGLWTFPTILSSSLIVAWAAAAAQLSMSRGLALALLAWVQMLPEFAGEAVIAVFPSLRVQHLRQGRG